MSLKKNLAIGAGAGYWLSCSFVNFILLSDPPASRTTPFEKTRTRRVAAVCAGPMSLFLASPVLTGMAVVDMVVDSKETTSELRQRLNNFLATK